MATECRIAFLVTDITCPVGALAVGVLMIGVVRYAVRVEQTARRDAA